MTEIHPTAVISSSASLDESAIIGPYAVINDDVIIGPGTEIGPHVIVGRWTRIGANNRIHTGAVVGTDSQDLKYKGGRTSCNVGDGNIFREYVTINRSSKEDEATVVGNDNIINAYCHIAHDCIVGNRILIENLSTLAGHVLVHDGVRIGSYVGVHQFCRIGTLSAIDSGIKVVKDIPPFVKVSGTPGSVIGLNLDGLDESSIGEPARQSLQCAYGIIYLTQRNVSQAIEQIRENVEVTPEIETVLSFLSASKRGICKNSDPNGDFHLDASQVFPLV